VEHYVRSGESWKCLVLTAPYSVLTLEAVSFAIALEEVYFDIAF